MGHSGSQAIFGLIHRVFLGRGTGVSLSTLTGVAALGSSATTLATENKCLSGKSVNPDIWMHLTLQSNDIFTACQGAESKGSAEEVVVWILGSDNHKNANSPAFPA